MPSPISTPENTVDIAWTLGDRIAKVRKVFGMQQEEFADLFGVTDGAVSKWETDASKPRDVLTFAAAVEAQARERGLRIPVVWLLTGDYHYGGSDLTIIPGDGDEGPQPELPFRPALTINR